MRPLPTPRQVLAEMQDERQRGTGAGKKGNPVGSGEERRKRASHESLVGKGRPRDGGGGPCKAQGSCPLEVHRGVTSGAGPGESGSPSLRSCS